VTYQQALDRARQVGAANAKGKPWLAMTIYTLCAVHAVNPELAYRGAVKLGLSAKQVRQLGPVEFGDLMFVE